MNNFSVVVYTEKFFKIFIQTGKTSSGMILFPKESVGLKSGPAHRELTRGTASYETLDFLVPFDLGTRGSCSSDNPMMRVTK